MEFEREEHTDRTDFGVERGEGEGEDGEEGGRDLVKGLGRSTEGNVRVPVEEREGRSYTCP